MELDEVTGFEGRLEVVGVVRKVEWLHSTLSISPVSYQEAQAILQSLQTRLDRTLPGERKQYKAPEVQTRPAPPSPPSGAAEVALAEHSRKNGANGHLGPATAVVVTEVLKGEVTALPGPIGVVSPAPEPPPAAAPAPEPVPPVVVSAPEPPAAGLPFHLTKADRWLPVVSYCVETMGLKTVAEILDWCASNREQIPALRASTDHKTRVMSTIGNYEPLQAKVTGWQI